MSVSNFNQLTNDGEAEFSIDGIPKIFETLSIVEDTADPDGTGELTYSWQIFNDDSTWEELGSDSSYLVADIDLDYELRAVISYQDDQGFEEEVLQIVS